MSFFITFIQSCERYGLPVRFLREVANSSYTITTGGQSQVNTWLNRMTLDEADIVSASRVADLAVRARQGVMNLYHEATHAWFDLKEDLPEVAAIVAHGRANYEGAPLLGNRTVDDPDRVFQEAMGEYVGHRVSTYWYAWTTLSSISSALKNNPSMRDQNVAMLLTEAKATRHNFDRLMAEATFGYQNQGWWFAADRQKSTTRSMSGGMREFAERVLLESKIPKTFTSAVSASALYQQLRRDYYPHLEG